MTKYTDFNVLTRFNTEIDEAKTNIAIRSWGEWENKEQHLLVTEAYDFLCSSKKAQLKTCGGFMSGGAGNLIRRFYGDKSGPLNKKDRSTVVQILLAFKSKQSNKSKKKAVTTTNHTLSHTFHVHSKLQPPLIQCLVNLGLIEACPSYTEKLIISPTGADFLTAQAKIKEKEQFPELEQAAAAYVPAFGKKNMSWADECQ